MQHSVHKHVLIRFAKIIHSDIHNLHLHIDSNPIEKQREQNQVWIQHGKGDDRPSHLWMVVHTADWL